MVVVSCKLCKQARQRTWGTTQRHSVNTFALAPVHSGSTALRLPLLCALPLVCWRSLYRTSMHHMSGLPCAAGLVSEVELGVRAARHLELLDARPSHPGRAK